MEIAEDELYLNLFGIIAYAIMSILILKVYGRDKSKALLFYSLSWIFNTLFLTFELLGFVLLNPFIWKMSYIILSFAFLSWMLFIDHAFSDEISWKRFSIGAIYCTVFVFWAFWPGNVASITSSHDGIQTVYTYTISYEILYVVMYDTWLILYSVTFLYWIVHTIKVLPENQRKNGMMMLFVVITILVDTTLFFLLDIGLLETFADILYLVSYILIFFSSVATTVIIFRFPKIIHLLPYRVYRLLVMSKGGTPYFEYRWTEDEINTVLLSGLFSAINTISSNISDDLKTGQVRSVHLDNVVFLLEPQYTPVTVGLVASKVSIDLRKSLQAFTNDFITKFQNVLYDGNGFPEEDPALVFKDEDMLALIDKHFNNVPKYIKDGVTTEELMEEIQEKQIEA